MHHVAAQVWREIPPEASPRQANHLAGQRGSQHFFWSGDSGTYVPRFTCTMVHKSRERGNFGTGSSKKAGEDDVFVAQFESCQFPGDQFRHADHLRLAWIYIRKYGCDVAEQRMRQSIQSFARSLGAAHKYHETITFFWVRLVDVDIRSSCPRETFADFVDAHPWLFEKDLVLEFYSRELLMSDAARRAWVEPDLKPIPH